MEKTHLRIAELNDAQQQKLEQLEKDLGAQILALEPQVRLFDLSTEQLEKLQQTESEMGVILLAYEA